MAQLVGRQQELRVLRAAVRSTESGRAGWVSLVGESGIGKSRLLAELADWAQGRGCLVLGGRGAELERDLPLGIWVDALDDYLSGLEPNGLARLAGPAPDELAAVFPALGRLGAAVQHGPTDDRYRTYRAVRRLLESLASTRPLLLILDDVHWADGSSLELIEFVLRRRPTARLLLVTAWRSGSAPELATKFAAAAHDRPGIAIELGPLSETEAGQLLGRPARTGELHESGGNPFYLLALTRDVQPGGHVLGREESVPVALAEGPELPEAVTRSVAAEIASLSAPARQLGQAAAVIGDRFEPWLASACSGLPDSLLWDALDQLVSAEVVRPTTLPTRFEFRHPIVRRAIYHSAAPGWRLAAHGRAATALGGVGAAAPVQAHHVALSAMPGDRDAVAVLTEAALSVQAQAPTVAARWWEAALRLLPEPTGPQAAQLAEQRLGVLLPLAAARAARGDLAGTLAALDESLTLLPPASPLRVTVVAGCVAAEHGLGRFGAARERLDRAVNEWGDEDPCGRLVLHLELATARLFVRDFSGALAWTDRVAADAAAIDGALEAAALALSCYIHCCAEDYPAAVGMLPRAATAVDTLSADQLVSQPQAAYWLGWAEFLLGRYGSALAHLQTVTQIGSPAGTRFVVPALREQARTLAALGRLDEARTTAEAAVDTARLAGNDWLTASALAAAAQVLTAAGELNLALQAADDALALVPADAPTFRQEVQRHAALIRLEMGDVEQALAGLAATGAPNFPAVEPSTRWLVQEALACAYARRGDVAAATDAGERCADVARRAQLPAAALSAARALAHVSIARRQPQDAIGELADAIRRGEAGDAVLDTARTRVLAGRCLLAADRPEDARSELLVAEQALREAGAARYRDEAAQLLRQLGVRRPGPARQAPPGSSEEQGKSALLSARERQIADLVVAGESNRSIAASLFLSEKTVETHLRRLYAKLGVRRRAEVATALNGHRPA